MSDKLTIEDLKEMDDRDVIELGYCPNCYSELIHDGGCTRCPAGCVDLCG